MTQWIIEKFGFEFKNRSKEINEKDFIRLEKFKESKNDNKRI